MKKSGKIFFCQGYRIVREFNKRSGNFVLGCNFVWIAYESRVKWKVSGAALDFRGHINEIFCPFGQPLGVIK